MDTADSTVAAVRRWFAALERGDPAPELCDPEVECGGPTAEAFEDVRFDLLEIEPLDERRCLTVQRLVGRFRLTGIEVDGAWGSIVAVRDGKILAARGYASPGRARKAAAAL